MTNDTTLRNLAEAIRQVVRSLREIQEAQLDNDVQLRDSKGLSLAHCIGRLEGMADVLAQDFNRREGGEDNAQE